MLGGVTSIFYNMMGRIETTTLIPTLKDLGVAYDKQDYASMKNKAHALKGACGYIGGGRVYYSCARIQDLYIS